jgi:hypothetical protein
MKPALLALLTGSCTACGAEISLSEEETRENANPGRYTHMVSYCEGDVPCEYAKRAWDTLYAGPHLHATCRLCGKTRAVETVK